MNIIQKNVKFAQKKQKMTFFFGFSSFSMNLTYNILFHARIFLHFDGQKKRDGNSNHCVKSSEL